MKTTAEYKQDPSVIGLTGAAKQAAIKALYEADKAAMPAAPKAKRPTAKEIDKKIREYNDSYHDIRVVRESDKAVALEVSVDFCDFEKSRVKLAWIPKSVLQNAQAPGWILDAKLSELTSEASSAGRGSVVARYVK